MIKKKKIEKEGMEKVGWKLGWGESTFKKHMLENMTVV